MSEVTLDRLLQVRLEGPEDQSKFDFKSVVDRWAKAKNGVFSPDMQLPEADYMQL